MLNRIAEAIAVLERIDSDLAFLEAWISECSIPGWPCGYYKYRVTELLGLPGLLGGGLSLLATLLSEEVRTSCSYKSLLNSRLGS